MLMKLQCVTESPGIQVVVSDAGGPGWDLRINMSRSPGGVDTAFWSVAHLQPIALNCIASLPLG